MSQGHVEAIYITSNAEATMRGVALNHMVGRDFSVGGARLRGH